MLGTVLEVGFHRSLARGVGWGLRLMGNGALGVRPYDGEHGHAVGAANTDALGAPWGQREVREGSQKRCVSRACDKQSLLVGGESPGHKHWSVKVWATPEGVQSGAARECSVDSSKKGQEGKLFQGTEQGVWTFSCLLCGCCTRHILDNL